MEPATEQVRYATYSKVIRVYERVATVWKEGFGDKAVFAKESRGFFALFEGSFESIHLGLKAPAFAEGDTVKITFEKVSNVKPS